MNPAAIARAISLLKSHASIASVVTVAEDVYTVAVRVPLPSRFRAQGSPSGVQAVEEVQLQFLASFPLTAPRLTLRPDFNPNLPHINPFRKGDRIPPCLLDGDLDAFHSQMGLLPVIDQLVAWLAKAGSGDLIDPEQGWEPSRRDSLGAIYEIDQHAVRNAPPASNKYQYWDVALRRDGQFHLCARFRGPLSGPRSMYATLAQNAYRTFGVVAMCDNTVADTYLPESVTTLGELTARARSIGCGTPFEEALRRLRRGETPKRLGNRPIVVVLICRRPFPLIGSTSSLEMLGYVLAPGWLDADPACEVVAAGHRQAISTRLLREVSGFAGVTKQTLWSLVGAGSLGSKIGLHLVRAGLGPAEIYDNGVMEPHNFARHGLCPTTPYAGKANGVCLEAMMMGQAEVRSEVGNILAILTGAEGKVFDEGIEFLVNTTGSIAVREGLAAASPSVRVPRVIEGSLLAEGKLGLMTTEGNQRNPSTMDLSCLSYRVMSERKGMPAKVFTQEASSALRIGQGCSSRTMVMSDATICSYAGPMSTRLSRTLSSSPPGGEIILWQSGSDGLSLNVEVLSVGPFRVVKTENALSTVRLSPSVVDSILAEVQGAEVEKGGILLGRFSEASGNFHVVDCFPAPPDSDSGPDHFILGVEGLRPALDAYENKLNGALYCVGTWHSHLGSAKSSEIDRSTAEKMRILDPLRPMVMVIVSEKFKWSALRVDCNSHLRSDSAV